MAHFSAKVKAENVNTLERLRMELMDSIKPLKGSVKLTALSATF